MSVSGSRQYDNPNALAQSPFLFRLPRRPLRCLFTADWFIVIGSSVLEKALVNTMRIAVPVVFDGSSLSTSRGVDFALDGIGFNKFAFGWNTGTFSIAVSRSRKQPFLHEAHHLPEASGS